MRKSFSDQSNRFYLEVMMPLEADEATKPVPNRSIRSSLSAIPAPNLATILAKKLEEVKKCEDEVEVEVGENETLRNLMCNGYKFVVNYGVFEPNFEWLPCEVKNEKR